MSMIPKVIRITKSDMLNVLEHWAYDDVDSTPDVPPLQEYHHNPFDVAFHYDFSGILPDDINAVVVREAETLRLSTYIDRPPVNTHFCCMICGDMFSTQTGGFATQILFHKKEHGDFLAEHPEYSNKDLYIQVVPMDEEDSNFLTIRDSEQLAREHAPPSLDSRELDMFDWGINRCSIDAPDNLPPNIPICPMSRP